ncbi:MAG: hypothetical protein IPN69_06195 [Acidobacteria bacterium]|nr:hypothetical protein [Acidobacteriota bacterium]
MPINLANKNRRDARVSLLGVRPKRAIRWLDEKRREAKTVRLLQCDIKHSTDRLLREFEGDLNDLAKAIVESDPEVDLETFGKLLAETSRVYAVDGEIAYHVEEFEVITDAEGNLKERRPRRIEPQNINSDVPLVWSGKFIKKSEAIRKFVFTGLKQITHNNGLTYDFLYEIAKELDEKDSFMLLGAGKGNQPLIFQRGGKPYRGFLEGRVDGDKYLLLLHLSNMEFKAPKGKPEEAAE